MVVHKKTSNKKNPAKAKPRAKKNAPPPPPPPPPPSPPPHPPSPPPPLSPPPKSVRSTITTENPITLPCTAEGCHKAFQAATDQLVRKALMRHLFRYQKVGVKVPKDAQDSDLTAKQIFDRAHYLAYQIEVVAYSTTEEKQAASRAKYKEANKEKVARASRISNYRAQAKKIPEIMGQGMEAVYKWAEEKEENRKEENRKQKEV